MNYGGVVNDFAIAVQRYCIGRAENEGMADAFDPEKLKANALTSIRLGVEDFQRSQAAPGDGGDPERALSAARNLFAGVLLLFKYRITQLADDSTEARKLIYQPTRLVPHPADGGGIVWKPFGNFKRTTIDLSEVRERFQTFGIKADWGAVEKLQDERNHLEHLHPTAGAGAVAGFVAGLFPVLRDFIEGELHEAPAEMLGEAWNAMLRQHAFFQETLAACKASWAAEECPGRMRSSLASARCKECDSPLIKPSIEENGEAATVDLRHVYSCMACGRRGFTLNAMEEALIEECGGWDPFDGEPSPVETCDECGTVAFVVHEQACRWCGHELDDASCSICDEPLGQEDQGNGGLCGYHLHQFSKDD